MATEKKPAAKKTPAKRASTKKEAKTIRNLRYTPVHLRLGPALDYRIQLAPRGQLGDISSVPVNLQEDHAYVSGLDVLFEIVTQTEARAIDYGPQGYQQTEVVRVDRPEDTVVATAPEWDGQGKQPPRQMGPTYVTPPGGDAELAEAMNAGEGAMPDSVPTKVVIERAKQQG